MKRFITGTSYGGERPLYGAQDMKLEEVAFLPGESALKHCRNLHAVNCRFEGKYPLWHCNDVVVDSSLFIDSARAAIWYTRNIKMTDTTVDAPKMFRECDGLTLKNVKLTNAAECMWNCRNIELHDCNINSADYLLMNGRNIQVSNLKLQGNYSFQDTKQVVVRDSYLDSKDAFWNTEDVTIYNSVIIGEYLGWHSKRLRLVNCTIDSTQALCYATDLILENCTMINTDLCFEYSSVQATVVNKIHSVKNPGKGFIRAHSIGEVIIDEFSPEPGACLITTEQHCS